MTKLGASGHPYDYYEPQVEEFKQIAEREGWDTTGVSLEEDIYKHYDLKMYNESESYFVDHKTMKMRQDDNFVVELQGITGHPGWIHGESDLIAQERHDAYALFETCKIKDLCDNVIDTGIRLDRPAAYYCYSRNAYDDLITMLPFNDIEDCMWDVWEK